MSVNYTNASIHRLTGQACYMRLQEAAGRTSPTEVLRQTGHLLEQLFRHLTREESRSFGNLFARMQFFFDKYTVPAALREQLSVLRNLTHKAITGTLVADTELALICIQTLARAIEHFYQTPIPESIEQHCTDVANKTLQYETRLAQGLIPQLKCLITQVGPLQKDLEHVPYFILDCRNDDMGEFQLIVSEKAFLHTTLLQGELRPYDTILVLYCHKGEAPLQYEAVSTTRIILEPDLLIDISDLAECFNWQGADRLLFLVKKLVPQSPGSAAFKGNVVNALLDNVLRSPEMDMKQSFVEAVSENVLHAAAYGREALNEMFHDIRNKHWPNLLRAAAELKDRPVRIEPTFFSALYGLQGRLDILAEDEKDPHRKEIFELKSGRCPNHGAWRNHEMQVVGYNMLLRSAFGQERVGSSAILYSSAPDTPLRNVSSNRQAENDLLSLRNEVVSQVLRIAAGEYDILDRITPAAAEGLPEFSAVHFKAFYEVYHQASPLLRTYYQQFLSFLLREYLLAKCGMYSAPDREEETEGFAALWLLPEQEKRDRFNIIPGLTYREFEKDNSTVIFDIHSPVNHNFRPGDTAIIYPQSPDGLFPLRHQVLKGRIDALGKNSLSFSLNNRQITHDFFAREQLWVIEHDIYESNYWIAATALFHVLEPKFAQRMELLLGQRAPVSVPLNRPCATMFNDNQQSILQAALEAQDYYLIQGPPGTGKTSTLLTALVASLHETNTQTVIVAFTNRAVEEICRKLDSKGLQYLRMGSRRSSTENILRNFSLNGDIKGAAAFIRSQRIFVGTVATMATRLQLLQMLDVKMDTLIADEASQLTEPQLLGLLMPFRKFILIGDQNQLPPVVAQDEHFCITRQPLLVEQGITDLRYTLFERLFQRCKQMRWHHAWGMLNTHFRMHNDIASLINHYYAGQLSSGDPSQSTPYDPTAHAGTDNWAQILSKGRTLFLPSPHEPTSKRHYAEAQRVVSLLRYLKKLHGDRFGTHTVGVVTPWRTQISLIREMIGEDEQLQAVNIDTAERFQGAENEIIIISLAVFHPVQLGLLQSLGTFHWEEERVEVDRKLLVTLSRAKQQVIMMGHEPVLRASTHYKDLLNNMISCT